MLRPALMAALWCAAAVTAAHAGTVQMLVTAADGSPVADAVVVVEPQATAAGAPAPLPPVAVIGQKDIRFTPLLTVVPVGASVRFVNEDRFDHHVRSMAGGPLGSVAPVTQFEYRLSPQRRGNHVSPDLLLDKPGAIVVGCHLHGSMRAHIYVSPTPHFAVTDANGRAQIQGVPEGPAQIRVWHPDQLVDSPPISAQVTGALAASTRLPFTPRRRPAPAPANVHGDYPTQ
ncbi:MAG: plastocyanin [Rubrivivax sp.]|nr:plastocyanin [Rubrivivax sp.]